jgi:putative hydrolase
MNDLPFGFSASSGDDGDGDERGKNPGDFDPNQLGQMLSQLGQMLSGMGAGMGTAGGGEPVNYQVATSLARQQIGKHTPVSQREVSAVTDSVRLAEVWLDAVTTLPAGVTTTEAWTPVDWLEKTLPVWKKLCNPVAEQMATTWSKNLPDEARQFAGPMLGMVSQMGGMAFGTQLGQGLGQLAKEVLTSSDIGLPLAPDGTAVLLPEAIAAFSDGLEQPSQEIIVFLAAREAAHVRLFSHVPWLRQRLLATVEEYARGISIDFSGIQDAAEGIDPAQLLSDPSKLQDLLAGGAAFEPKTSPAQEHALARLETLLALIEGWVETVVTQALTDRIPSVGALTETMRRRRATGGPAEETFATLIGLELRPRKLREAADLWSKLLESSDVTTRDGVWAHPDLVPDSDDLDHPAAFIDRVIGGGVDAFDDPIAQLEKTIADEAEKRGNKPTSNDDGDDETGDSGPSGKHL